MKDHRQISEDLVLFALRELPPNEAEEIRRHLDDCASCRRELGDINSDMAVLALSSVGPAPPQRSRERLLNAVKAEPRRLQRVVMRRRWWSLVPYFALVLLAAFALLLVRDNVSLRRKLETAEQRSGERQADLERARFVLEALTSPESNHFALVSSSAQAVPEGRASYLLKNGTLVFTAQHMKPLPDEKTYQLWLIPSTGDKPMPCGTFKPDAHGNASMVMPAMKPAHRVPAKMFAVTIEPEGGSETPTMPMVMAGL